MEKQQIDSRATADIEEEPTLSPHRAFVVQFRVGAGVEQERFVGRVDPRAYQTPSGPGG